ncbi:unnamed protein product [Cylicostephanus goldi]|uniref:Cullin family profile domain-containing protein n=1 Tax=Cylicostephanus goldi TaxID=71465 RepID=A0A3P7MCE9_CYLGO|nr:unnamed protein product [Cylicostephanus goldi]
MFQILDVLDLKERFDEFLLMSFQRDKAFKNIIQAEFETFVNLNKNSPEYLSLYMDEKLRKGFKTHMARRLLLDRSLSDDLERMMISKLKVMSDCICIVCCFCMCRITECGYQFTLRLENMYRDKELWSTHAAAFREVKEALPGENVIDISVRVLTAGVWPTQSAPVCILPPVCENAFNVSSYG